MDSGRVPPATVTGKLYSAFHINWALDAEANIKWIKSWFLVEKKIFNLGHRNNKSLVVMIDW